MLDSQYFLGPWFLGLLALCLALERLRPVRPGQAALSPGFDQDALWTALKLVNLALVFPLLVEALRAVLDSRMPFLRLRALEAWPLPARFLVGLAWTDLAGWATHLARHKVPLFWRFHAIHHSQTELNFLTEFRVHPGDDVFKRLLEAIPHLMVERSTGVVLGVALVRYFHVHLYHCNVRSDLGWLRYVLVTPQSHRIHHSADPRHADTNYGVTSCIWDRLFGTHYEGGDEYPGTGTDDPALPLEQVHGAGLATFLRQLLHPFLPRSPGAAAR